MGGRSTLYRQHKFVLLMLMFLLPRHNEESLEEEQQQVMVIIAWIYIFGVVLPRRPLFDDYKKGKKITGIHDMIEESVEVFMDAFSVFGNSFDKWLNNLDKMLQRCKDAHLVLNWEKCHFIVKEGIVLGHKVSGVGVEVDKAKIDVISNLPPLPISNVLKAF
uniref:Reverse transcriptase domain-containing protein n=1 Tax=Tanacetum cinerariifolium TaxID=118510 RepID=A0A6L2JF38_TANCI|nr:reverse transcriptase domain-containing protein [Tanacetum cinerariifolium]